MLKPALMVVGISFRTAPLAVRERFWIGQPQLGQARSYLAGAEGIEEAFVVSTCERTEFLIWASDATLAANSVLHLLSSEFRLQLCDWKHFYRLVDEDAMVHLFRLAGGLDSAIVDEPAFHLQKAWEKALQAGCSGKCLGEVLEKAFAVSRRSGSEASAGPVRASLASLVVENSKRIFGSLEHRAVVLIGAGSLGEVLTACIANQGAVKLRILNRTFERAVQLANKVAGTAVPFEDLQHEIGAADVVICCTASSQPLLSAHEVRSIVQQQKRKRLCIVDLGLPRNLDPQIRDIAGVFLYDLDDLSKARGTSKAMESGEAVLVAEAKQFHRSLAGKQIVPTVVALRQRLDELCRQELQEFRQEWGPFPKDQEHLLVALTSQITQRLANSLARELKEVPEKSEQEHMKEAVHRLFHLELEKELVGNNTKT